MLMNILLCNSKIRDKNCLISVEQIQALGATLPEGGSLSREDMSAASLFALNAGNIAACRDTTPDTPAR